MEFKGTKGDWILKPDFREPKILNESGQVIFTHNKNCYDSIKDNHVGYSHNKMIANAKLIEQAPKLLEMLEWILESKNNINHYLMFDESLLTALVNAEKVIEKIKEKNKSEL